MNTQDILLLTDDQLYNLDDQTAERWRLKAYDLACKWMQIKAVLDLRRDKKRPYKPPSSTERIAQALLKRGIDVNQLQALIK